MKEPNCGFFNERSFVNIFEVIKDVNQVDASSLVSGQLRYNSEKKLRILTDAQKEFKFDRRRRHR